MANPISNLFAFFGFELTPQSDQQKQEEQQREKTFTLPDNNDGAVIVQHGAYYGTYVDLDGVVRNEIELITRYREMAMQPDMEYAIDNIVNDAIVTEENGRSVDINLDNLEGVPAKIKKIIKEEFQYVLKLLNFGHMGHDIFRRWYVDGRLFYHVVVDETNLGLGIQEVRYIDPRRIRKIKEIFKQRDSATGLEMITVEKEYYLYNERGMIGVHSNLGAKITPDSIVNINSGLMDSKRAMVISYLHKAIKPLNQLRIMEDATVIYRLSRAPERRAFYIDVGNLSTQEANKYMQMVMSKYRTKLVYDSATGEIRDDRKHLAMLEDFWLPRREGSSGTQIETLPGGQNLGVIEDVDYFLKRLYKALGIPLSRLDSTTGFSLGRAAEITQDELNFQKFVNRLRNKFSGLFDELMKRQLVLKGICSEEDWDNWEDEIWYDFLKDNNFDELKEAELNRERVALLAMVDPFVGVYYSQAWVKKNVLMMDEDEIKEIDAEIEEEREKMTELGLDMHGQPLMPPGGMDPNAQGGQQFDPATGGMIDPNTGVPVDPTTSVPIQTPPAPGQASAGTYQTDSQGNTPPPDRTKKFTIEPGMMDKIRTDRIKRIRDRKLRDQQTTDRSDRFIIKPGQMDPI
jgi:hypothetical protein